MLSRWQCELVGHCAQSCSCKSTNTLLLVLGHMISASLITAHDETFFTGDNVQTSWTLKVKEKTKGWVKFGRASLYDVSGTAGAGGVFIHVIIEGSCAHPFVNSRLCCGDPDGGRWVRWPVQLHLSKTKYTFSNFFFLLSSHIGTVLQTTLNNFPFTPAFIAFATVVVFHCSLLLKVKALSGQWKYNDTQIITILWKLLVIIQGTPELLAPLVN